MAEYEGSTIIQAPVGKVFDFVSDVENLPKYLPTTKHAEPGQGEHVRVQGEADGHRYDAEGYFRTDDARHRMEWGADEQDYSGWLQVQAQGSNASRVTVHLTFRKQPPSAQGESADDTMQEGLDNALESIKNELEGHGSKVESSAARS